MCTRQQPHQRANNSKLPQMNFKEDKKIPRLDAGFSCAGSIYNGRYNKLGNI